MTTGKINIDNYTLVTMSVSEMNHRIAKAIADEREACAQIADEHARRDFNWASENAEAYHAQANWATHIAHRIRARGNA